MLAVFGARNGLKRAQSVRSETRFYHMIALIQRVTGASVRIDERLCAEIGTGLLALIGVVRGDDSAPAAQMSLSWRDTSGGRLLVPQFTLAADTSSGNRPGFSGALEPAQAAALFDYVVAAARASHAQVASGVCGANMQVSLVNDGAVTFWLES